MPTSAISHSLPFHLNTTTKGYPPHAAALPLREAGQQGWQLLRGDLPLPLAVLKAQPLNHNLRWMQDFCNARGIDIAPHGKTTMSPELYQRQLQAGAWGISFANVQQAGIGLAHGVQRIVIANQVLQDSDLLSLHTLLQHHTGARVCFLVDSLAQVERIHTWQTRHPDAQFEVLLELGIEGKRTGVRSPEQGLQVARAIAQTPALRLVGVECYEGALVSCQHEEDRRTVGALMHTLHALARQCEAEALFDTPEVLLTAGGSSVFDLVGEQLRLDLGRPVRGVLRSGCYVTHDHGQYQRHVQSVAQRIGQTDTLQPALEVLSMVQSCPEPGLALLTMGKRDVSYDLDMPIPLWRCTVGAKHTTPCPTDWRISALNDQHAYLRYDPQTDAAQHPHVGDIVGSGISHPCTTFDKWRWMPIVDENYHVVDAISVLF